MKLTTTFILALLVAGHAIAAPPTQAEPSATIHMTSNHTGMVTSNLFLLCNDAACEPRKGGKQLAAFSWGRGNEKSVSIQANKPVRIRALYARNAGTGEFQSAIARAGIPCTSTLEFTPLAGHTYQIRQAIDEEVMAKASTAAVEHAHATGQPLKDVRNEEGCSIVLADSDPGASEA